MSVQIADATNFITITIDGIVYWTLPKRETILEVAGTQLDFLESIEYADVSSPATANVEALRTAVNNFLIT